VLPPALVGQGRAETHSADRAQGPIRPNTVGRVIEALRRLRVQVAALARADGLAAPHGHTSAGARFLGDKSEVCRRYHAEPTDDASPRYQEPKFALPVHIGAGSLERAIDLYNRSLPTLHFS